MAMFKGFETFEVYADSETLYIEQVSIEFGKPVVIQIPVSLWAEVVKAAEFEIDKAAE